MPKIELVALAATGLLIFGGAFTAAPAFAEDDEKDDNERTSQSTPTPKIQSSSDEDSEDEDSEDESVESEINESRETELKHQELEEKYGKEGHLSLPPLVIRPEGFSEPGRSTLVGGAGSFIGLGLGLGLAPKNPAGADQRRPTETVIINPEKNIAIDISAVSPAKKTPADVFIESATTGLLAMGFGAVGLGVVAGTRAIRRR